jgi:hypothetical protein
LPVTQPAGQRVAASTSFGTASPRPGEAGSTVNESWVQFDLGADYDRFTFTIQQDNCCTWMTTH